MTIAAVYVTPEGVVLGADSTLTVAASRAGEPQHHYFNHNQKLLEISLERESSTYGIITWGLGSLGGVSYRTLVAQLADDLAANPATTPSDVANRWVSLFFPKYTATIAGFAEWTALHAKQPFDPNASAPLPSARTAEEQKRYDELRQTITVGFCLGGYSVPAREPAAFEMLFKPDTTAAPSPTRLGPGQFSFWGAPNMITRLIGGHDPELFGDIKASGKWSGTDAELKAVLDKFFLSHQSLPIRDAIDFVHSCIYSTIKAMKFSNLPQICGGPIELAVITTDRKFRWVRHKSWDTAVQHGD